MNKLIVFPLMFLFLLNVMFYDITHSQFSGEIRNAQLSDKAFVFGTFTLSSTSFVFIFLSAIVIVAVISSINILGSGLQSASIITALKVGAYIILFGILSVQPLELFFISTGADELNKMLIAIWLGLGIFYAVGVVSEISYSGV